MRMLFTTRVFIYTGLKIYVDTLFLLLRVKQLRDGKSHNSGRFRFVYRASLRLHYIIQSGKPGKSQ